LPHPSLLTGSALALALLVPLSTVAQAQSAPSPVGHDDSAADPAADAAGHAPIVVSGRLISSDRDAISAPVVLSGEDLVRNSQPQIGAMLARLPGVSTSGFAPGASRPVLRGFDGPRVQILSDGLGSLDASSVSADHGVALDTMNVSQVDVLHGPEVLLYAADPAGGAVNALDKRIPRAMPENPISVTAQGTYSSVARTSSAGGALDVALAPRLAAHIDASFYDGGNLRVGGNVLSPGLRAQTLSDAADLAASGDSAAAADLTNQANASGRLANSFAHGATLGAGIAFIDAGGSLGVSVEHLTSDYGIPPRPAVGNGDPVTISLRQTRYDLRGRLNLSGFFDHIDLRGAYGDYTHAELDSGVVSTRFVNKAIETRLELVQARHGDWRGESGIQFGTRNLDVIGDEKLIPDTATTRIAAFTRQQLTTGAVDFEATGRLERTAIRTKPDGSERVFHQVAAGAGMAWHPAESLTLNLSATHGERAPSAEELYIDGIHDATQSYERGNPLFRKERSDTVEAGARYHGGRLAAAVTAYATNFHDFITPVPTGATIEGFPVYQFLQVPAKFRGFETEASVKALQWGDRSVSIDGGADYVHAQLTGIGPAPRIPPLRVRGGVEYDSPALTLRAEAIRNTAQNRVAANEFAVGGFTLVNASATWRPLGKDGPLSLILSADNLLNVEGRLATSETRDFVPIAGRDLRIAASIHF
jgi:iron complex outermembrane receptor protein